MSDVTFFLDGEGRVMKVSILGGEDMLSDVIRLSGMEFSSGKNPGEFVPKGKLYFRNILESYAFYRDGIEGVDDISIEPDRDLIGFKGIIVALENHLKNVELPEDRQALSALLDHICLEGWNGGCEGGCGTYVRIDEVIKNFSTLCNKCRAAEE